MSDVTVNPLTAAPGRVLLAGDWHGDLPFAQSCIEWGYSVGVSTFVQLGDLNYMADDEGRRFLTGLATWLDLFDADLLWLDGNHEDHSALNALPLDPATGLRPVESRIWHLPRGFRWQWHGHTWMALGGAHSVDRSARTPHTWWPGEVLSDSDVAYATRPGEVTMLLTHDMPSQAHLPRLDGHSYWPEHDLAAAEAHRARVGAVVDAVQPAHVWHGHHHHRYDQTVPRDQRQPLTVHGLGCNGQHIDLAAVVIDTTTLGWHPVTEAGSA